MGKKIIEFAKLFGTKQIIILYTIFINDDRYIKLFYIKKQ